MSRHSLVFIFILLLSAFSSGAAADEKVDYHLFKFSNLSTDNHLSSPRVYSIVEGDGHEMWFGTKRGVDRYNGHQVKNYLLPSDNRFSDASGLVVQLTKDNRQQLVAYNNKGKIYVYNPVLDRFDLRYNLRDYVEGYPVVNRLVVDAHGNCWLALSTGLYRISASGRGQWVRRGLGVNHLDWVGKRAQALVACTSEGVFLHEPARRHWSTIARNLSVYSTYYDASTHRLWLGTFHDGVRIFDMRAWRTIETPAFAALPHIPVRTIRKYDERTMLFGIDGAGVYAGRRDATACWLLFNADDKTGGALHGNGVYDICRDGFGNIWMGSYSGGGDLAVPIGRFMESVTHEYLNAQSLLNNAVNAVAQTPDGNIWYATDQGVSIYNIHTSRWNHTLYNKVVLTLCALRSGEVLAGTYGGGVFAIGGDGTARQRYSVGNGKLKTDYVYSLLTDRDGTVWIGCLDGALACVAGSATRYFDLQQVQTLANMPDGRVAVGTTNGLFAVDKRKGRVQSVFTVKEIPTQDINYFIQSVIFTNAETAWIATDGGGIYLYNLRKRKWKSLSEAQGLPSNTVYALARDRYGRVLASTDVGLAMIYPKPLEVVNINFVKGLEQEYKRMSVCPLADGRVVFGGSGGALIVNPALLDRLAYKAPLRITGLRPTALPPDEADAVSTRLFNMLAKGDIRLPHDRNTFDISFESVNYKYQHDILYQYKLEGFDNDWSKLAAAQSAHYTNLPPGDYRFKVRTVSRNDGHVVDEKEVRLGVAEPWWNSGWAWLVYWAAFAGLAYGAWKTYRGRLERRYFDEKINFFVNTAHDIRTPLTLILAPLNDLAEDKSLSESSKNLLEMARRNGGKLLHLVTQLLDFQKADLRRDAMEPCRLNLKDLLLDCRERFSLVAGEKHIELAVAECPDDQDVRMDRNMADKIFDNLLSNAVKYTPEGGRITLRATVAGGKVCIEIADTGIGIPKGAQRHIFQNFFRADNAVNSRETGSGLGLMLAQRLVKLHHGRLSFVSQENVGTTFRMTLPLAARKAEDRSAQPHSPVAPRPTTPTVVRQEPTDMQQAGEGQPKETLLFVDDNDELRAYIQQSFQTDYQVVTAASGEAALEYLEGNVCDIVVSDVMMGGMDGDELCRRIKDNADTSWLPVILLTAKSGRNFIIEGLAKGADDYITKPFDVAILRGKIESMLQNRRRLSAYYMQRALDMTRAEANGRKPDEETRPTSLGPVGDDEAKAESRVVEAESMAVADQAFVEKATRIVMDNMSDADFNIDRLCREMAMSRTLFYGRLKTLTARTPQDFVRIIRLERAAVLLRAGRSVLDVSVMTGFANVKHFSTTFKKHFGVPPSRYGEAEG